MNRGELARFMRNVDQSGDCWLWTGQTMRNGYGCHRVGPGKPIAAAHRLCYEHFRGPIGDGLQLDHLCRVRECVNPDHLEPVTPSENTRRQDHAERRVTHCPSGHPYDDTNTMIRSDGKRRCRECDRARKRAI